MRLRFFVALACALAAIAFVPTTSRATGGCSNIFGTLKCAPMAEADVQMVRLGSSDSLDLRMQFRSALPLTKVHWEVTLPTGLTFLAGALHGSGLTPPTQWGYLNWGSANALVRCEHWGDFRVALSIRAAADSLNWSSSERTWAVRVTPDSCDTQLLYGEQLQRIVIDGVHYRDQYLTLIPLDLGEDERVQRDSPSWNSVEPATAIHRQPVARAAAAVADSINEVAVWVVVDRSGRVKATDPATGPAADAARKWTFEPAISLGRPITKLYLIKVPVVAATGR